MDKKHIGYIKNGINLDHIFHGRAFYLMQILKLFNIDNQVGVGLNLPSNKMGSKDLIKIEDFTPSIEQINALSLFAPGATLAIIKDFQIQEKSILSLPSEIESLIICPNPRCVSKLTKSKFKVQTSLQGKVMLNCHYCEKEFELDQTQEFKFN